MSITIHNYIKNIVNNCDQFIQSQAHTGPLR